MKFKYVDVTDLNSRCAARNMGDHGPVAFLVSIAAAPLVLETVRYHLFVVLAFLLLAVLAVRLTSRLLRTSAV